MCLAVCEYPSIVRKPQQCYKCARVANVEIVQSLFSRCESELPMDFPLWLGLHVRLVSLFSVVAPFER